MKARVGRGVTSRLLKPGKAAGFTIIETMVVLTVTGALFVAIAATLTGRQNEAQFAHAIQSVRSQLQQTIDEVSAGFFPAVELGCSSGAGSLTFSATGTQGTNDQCVFLGKVVQFHVQGTNPEQYQVYTVAGKRAAVSGSTSPFESATPTVVGLNGNYADYSVSKTLEYGLTTAWATANGATIGAVGFLMEPGGFAATGGYNSGSQPVDLVPIPGTTVNPPQSVTTAVGIINAQLNDPNLTADAPIGSSTVVKICFVSGSTNQSGLISIGGSGRQLVVSLDIKSNLTCS